MRRCATCGYVDGHAGWCQAPPPRLGDWITRGLCEDVDMFSGGGRVDLIKLCRRCPVRRQCAEYAIASGVDDGIWGGLSPTTRRYVAAGHQSLEGALRR